MEVKKHRSIPHLGLCVILEDFHEVAKSVLPEKAYIYISSTSSSSKRIAHYRRSWSQLALRPRVMRDVSSVDTSLKILSLDCPFPFFIAPMGLIGTAHSEGELAFARAAADSGIHYCVSTATSKNHEEIMECFQGQKQELELSAEPTRTGLFFQLYVHSQSQVTKDLLSRIRQLGYKGLFITVDTPVVGKRSADRRLQARELADLEVTAGEDANKAAIISKSGKLHGGRAPPGVLSQTLNWEDVSWIRNEWQGPIVIKGIQCAEDASIAANLGVEGIYLSNHGGRQLQDAVSSLDTLMQIREQFPDLLSRVEVYVDGGFSTGADILKALCLGARAVGIGRPFMYAVAAYGTNGVMRAIDGGFPFEDIKTYTDYVAVLTEEIEIGMRLLGVKTLAELKPEMISFPQTSYLTRL
jgi:L-lactate dehydrogenase (cytochrome)